MNLKRLVVLDTTDTSSLIHTTVYDGGRATQLKVEITRDRSTLYNLDQIIEVKDHLLYYGEALFSREENLTEGKVKSKLKEYPCLYIEFSNGKEITVEKIDELRRDRL